MSVTLTELELGGAVAAWERLGFAADGDGLRVGAVGLRFPGGEPAGIAGWTLAGARSADLDGLRTRVVAEAEAAGELPAHPNGALRLDHVVVFTPDLDRTFAAFEAAGLELRRVRDAGTPEHPLRQGFFRLGDDLGAPRDAVQPGRRIATVRESAGLGVPVAFMSPAPNTR